MKNRIHWCKQKKMWTSHTYKKCTKANKVLIIGDWFTETKPNNKYNPRGWVVAHHGDVFVNPTDKQLSEFKKSFKLIYDKEDVSFNLLNGTNLLFDDEGCFILERIK